MRKGVSERGELVCECETRGKEAPLDIFVMFLNIFILM